VLGRAGVTGVEINMINRIEPPTAHKLRRVRCDWRCD
jgi:hypothetical protein